jgi:hypothetical protein
MESKRALLWGILGLLVGIGLGYWYADQAATSRYEAQMERVRSIVPSVSEAFFISGTVKDVRDASIILGDLALSGDPLSDLPSEMEVTVGADTVILKRVYKDLAVFQEEFTDYQRRLNRAAPGSAPIEAPASYIETEATIADLEEGLRVEVHSKTNIKNETRFEASKIIFQ